MSNMDLFEILVGNKQMKAVADSLVQYPKAHLLLCPNLLETPDYLIEIPMTKGPLSPFCASTRRVAFVTTTSEPPRRTFLSRLCVGGCRKQSR